MRTVLRKPAPRAAADAQASGASLPAQHHYLYIISRIRCLNNRPFNRTKFISILASFPICNSHRRRWSIRWNFVYGKRHKSDASDRKS
ncbi:hypothetical protein KCP78_20600 [Salmonella enterica subsp. enterica]|nr:hypothetical protein KCP78_20600 [Salmonella enterica subsp. enterica]